ncbi:ISAon1 family transposase N-terminal region protein [Bacteroides fragilis]|uniref:ISAon1 family transposase N-terminal region protein n=1 Tax=Bacteroides fragilis TaxID=817 RepID=UPI003CC7EF02
MLFLEEKSSIPEKYSHLHLHSKGFFPEIEVQDFPIRGKTVYLRIKRRRWEDPETGQTYSHDWKRGQGKAEKAMSRRSLATGILLGNCWLEAGICCSRYRASGRTAKNGGLEFCSSNSRI